MVPKRLTVVSSSLEAGNICYVNVLSLLHPYFCSDTCMFAKGVEPLSNHTVQAEGRNP